MPSLETPRLILRPLERGDAPAMAVLANNEAVALHLERVSYPYTFKDAEDFISHTQRLPPDHRIFAVIHKDDHQFMGVVGLEGDVLGYWLGQPFWGQRYGTEAMTALVQFAFVALQRPQLRASVLMDNVASRRIFERLGFIQTGTKDCTSRAFMGTKPGVWYTLLREDFVGGQRL